MKEKAGLQIHRAKGLVHNKYTASKSTATHSMKLKEKLHDKKDGNTDRPCFRACLIFMNEGQTRKPIQTFSDISVIRKSNFPVRPF